MQSFTEAFRAYIHSHSFESGSSDGETVLDQIYQVYWESQDADPPEIQDGFRRLGELLGTLPLDDNNAVFTLCCRLCTAYEHKAFRDGLLYGAHIMQEIFSKEDSQESSNTGIQ